MAQEYGGGAFKISGDTVVFSNYKDQRLYKQSIHSKGYSLAVASIYFYLIFYLKSAKLLSNHFSVVKFLLVELIQLLIRDKFWL